MFPIVSSSEAHFNFAPPFFACPIGRTSKIVRPKNEAEWINFLQACLSIFGINFAIKFGLNHFQDLELSFKEHSSILAINPYYVTGLFLYPLKTSGNLWFSDIFKGYRKKSVFFLSGFSFTDTNDSRESKRREETIFYFTIPLPPAHEFSAIYLQLCMWDDYHVFLTHHLYLPDCYSMRFTTLLNYHLID